MTTQHSLDELTYEINAAAIEVHKLIGPGLLESVYHKCLEREFSLRGIQHQSEVIIPLTYKGIQLESSLRCDFLIENSIVIELKSVDQFLSIHTSQLLSYMQQLQAAKGILYNFNCSNLIRQGQKTFVNKIFGALPVR